MEIFVATLICLLPFALIVRTILLTKKSTSVSVFMKDILIAILVGVLLVSISVSVHHFFNLEVASKANMSLGVLVMVQSIISGVVFLIGGKIGRKV